MLKTLHTPKKGEVGKDVRQIKCGLGSHGMFIYRHSLGNPDKVLWQYKSWISIFTIGALLFFQKLLHTLIYNVGQWRRARVVYYTLQQPPNPIIKRMHITGTASDV